jgi:hypothetical protein
MFAFLPASTMHGLLGDVAAVLSVLVTGYTPREPILFPTTYTLWFRRLRFGVTAERKSRRILRADARAGVNGIEHLKKSSRLAKLLTVPSFPFPSLESSLISQIYS